MNAIDPLFLYGGRWNGERHALHQAETPQWENTRLTTSASQVPFPSKDFFFHVEDHNAFATAVGKREAILVQMARCLCYGGGVACSIPRECHFFSGKFNVTTSAKRQLILSGVTIIPHGQQLRLWKIPSAPSRARGAVFRSTPAQAL